jgi:hypothetical protein
VLGGVPPLPIGERSDAVLRTAIGEREHAQFAAIAIVKSLSVICDRPAERGR